MGMSATARKACSRRRQCGQVAGATSWMETHKVLSKFVSTGPSLLIEHFCRLRQGRDPGRQQAGIAPGQLRHDALPVVLQERLAARLLAQRGQVALEDG